MRTPRALTAVAFYVCLSVVTGAFSVTRADTVTIAVVRDGPSTSDLLVEQIEAQLRVLVDPAITLEFKKGPEFDAGWQGDRAALVIQAALRDRSVDYILGVGLLVTQAAADPGLKLTKPFISAHDQRADVPRLPWEGDGSLKENLALIVVPQGAERDVTAFQKISPFRKLYVGIDPVEARYIEDLEAGLKEYEGRLGITIESVMIGNDVTEAIAALPDTAEAFYLTSFPRLSEAQRSTLIDALNERRIPTFSSEGHPDVERGALAAITPDVSDLLVRRVAINISRLIRGEATADLPVVLQTDAKLLINGRTAAAIGYEPNFEARAFANYLHREDLETETKPLTLQDAVLQAQETNVSLQIKDAELETTERDKQFARGFLLPQINADGGVTHNQPILDHDSGSSISGGAVFPTDLSSAGISVTQMLYDDATVSAYRSSDRFYDGNQWDRERERLDVVLDASLSYLDLAQARVLYQIEVDNVQLTEDNLDLSRIRYDVGYSGKDEVFRWKAELAARRGGMLVAGSDIEAARIGLNQVLGINQTQRWQTDEMTVDPETFTFLGVSIAEYIASQQSVDAARDYWTMVATENAPELKFLTLATEAQGIQAGSRKRRFFIPTFTADFRYDYYFNWEPEFRGRRDDSWRVRVAASYPLFLGSSKYYDMKREQAALRGLENERELQRQFVERRVRTILRRMDASFPNILLATTSSENSNLNLDVVQEKYAQGILNVTDLLSAQNQAFVANQAAVIAVYQFLIDLEQFQRAISWFEREKAESENNEMASRFLRAVGQ